MRLLWAGLALSLAACDPPCKEYWSVACARCGESSSGCESAQKRAGSELEAGGACQEATATLKEVIEEPGGKEVVCALPRKGGPPSKSLRGDWSCEGTRVSLGLERVKVGEAAFDVVQFSTDFLNLKLDASKQTSCNLHLDGVHLRIRCATPLGALPAGDVNCVRNP